jgi:hypothetical protein
MKMAAKGGMEQEFRPALGQDARDKEVVRNLTS